MKPEITRWGFLNMQVCVPETYTDGQVIDFIESEQPCGTEHGWTIQKEGDSALEGAPERVPCSKRKNCVHIMVCA